MIIPSLVEEARLTGRDADKQTKNKYANYLVYNRHRQKDVRDSFLAARNVSLAWANRYIHECIVMAIEIEHALTREAYANIQIRKSGTRD